MYLTQKMHSTPHINLLKAREWIRVMSGILRTCSNHPTRDFEETSNADNTPVQPAKKVIPETVHEKSTENVGKLKSDKNEVSVTCTHLSVTEEQRKQRKQRALQLKRNRNF